MAVFINGIKVSGRGAPGKTAYQAALEGGYTGSESTFNKQLASIGTQSISTASLTDQVWAYGDTPPENTNLFWIDSNSGLKYYNGSAWVAVPIVQ